MESDFGPQKSPASLARLNAQTQQMLARQNVISYRIREIALTHCIDYPGIDEVDELEMLYAISCNLEGTALANHSCHSFIRYLGAKLGMTNTEIYREWKNFEENA